MWARVGAHTHLHAHTPLWTRRVRTRTAVLPAGRTLLHPSPSPPTSALQPASQPASTQHPSSALRVPRALIRCSASYMSSESRLRAGPRWTVWSCCRPLCAPAPNIVAHVLSTLSSLLRPKQPAGIDIVPPTGTKEGRKSRRRGYSIDQTQSPTDGRRGALNATHTQLAFSSAVGAHHGRRGTCRFSIGRVCFSPDPKACCQVLYCTVEYSRQDCGRKRSAAREHRLLSNVPSFSPPFRPREC